MTKKIVKYTSAYFYGGAANPVGFRANVTTLDHPDFTIEQQSSGEGLDTSTIVSYDETTGQFETQNTLYVPSTSTVLG